MAIRNKKYIVRLDQEERESLQRLVRVGKAAARKISRARILLKADAGEGGPGWTDQRIADALDVSFRTAENVRRCCVEEGLELAVQGRPAPDRPWQRKLDGVGEAKLIALSCSEPPSGRTRWTLELLGDALVALNVTDSISYETVRRTLKKTS
ncbi:MAG: helix-turn-helix domain-containing protein [Planctomycetes bacterium]|nr:helix-turn-helix domain-containing protein [Planctomycetota bacterium]